MKNIKSYKQFINENKSESIEVILDFANDDYYINIDKNRTIDRFQPNEEGLFEELFNLLKNGYYHNNIIIPISFSYSDEKGNEKWDDYELQISYGFERELKKEIDNLFKEINATI